MRWIRILKIDEVDRMSEHKKETAFFSIRNLTVEYHSGNSVIYAVNDVSFDLKDW